MYGLSLKCTTEKKTDYPLHIRTYHVQLAEEDMKHHKDYKDMKEDIVIFICTEDYFGEKRPVYTFGTMETTRHLILDEKRSTIFINPDGVTEDEEIKAFLNYLKEGTVTDNFTKEIENTVVEIKEDQDFRGSYMTLEEKFKDFREDGYKEGKEEGIAEGRNEGLLALVSSLRPFMATAEEMHKTIISNEAYKDISLETVKDLFEKK